MRSYESFRQWLNEDGIVEWIEAHPVDTVLYLEQEYPGLDPYYMKQIEHHVCHGLVLPDISPDASAEFIAYHVRGAYIDRV